MALAMKLAPQLQEAEGARVVALSSTGHTLSDVIWEDPHFETRAYDKWVAYGQSKSANALFALGRPALPRRRCARLLGTSGRHLTNLQRHLPDEEMVVLGWKNPDGTLPERVKQSFKTPEQGASTSVWAATAPKLAGKGGVYCEDCDIAKAATPESQRYEHAREWISDDARAEKLWAMSEKMLADA